MGNNEFEVDALLVRLMEFHHGKLVIQIPRYLFLLEQFIKEKGNDITKISTVSRNELFEYFIYSKLNIEDKLGSNEAKKRVLEKLALVMEIYQTNSISRDELMTFFDDIKSDLKTAIIVQGNFNLFIDKTVLWASGTSLDKIEFENTEFQEYLAAKEITRFTDPVRATFHFTADQNINELHPSWLNTLNFLVDLMPSLLEPLVEFS